MIINVRVRVLPRALYAVGRVRRLRIEKWAREAAGPWPLARWDLNPWLVPGHGGPALGLKLGRRVELAGWQGPPT